MAGLKDLSSVWKNIKEIDLKPIRELATTPLRIVIVGSPGSGRHTLAEQMRTDPARPGIHTQSTLALTSLEAATEAPTSHLTIMLVDASRTDFTEEQALVKKWSEAGKNVLVFINKLDLVGSNVEADARGGWSAPKVIYGSVIDVTYLQQEFIPTVLELLPLQHLALGRQFPLFRLTIARQLINEACLSNAAYSFSTGLAEIVPVLDLPLNLTDMVVLTKSQAFLAYKLGLLLGFSTRWQDYITEFGSVIGTGFIWRQVARELIGLVPGWGIIPKVAVSYSGTYVVGNAILGWYLTGRNLSPKQMRALYAQAFSAGKDYARKLAAKIPRPRLGRGKREKLPAGANQPQLGQGEIVLGQPGQVSQPGAVESNVSEISPPGQPASPESAAGMPERSVNPRPGKRWGARLRGKKAAADTPDLRTCPECGKMSAQDASFCQYCGARLDG